MAASRHQQRFTVYINEGEKHQIEEWVKIWPNTQTGGDLFGALIDDHTAVVQFVLGPGRDCRRTGASFYQNVDYLRDAGSYLTQQHGLCNIGEWHSHHQLGLTRPSGGDENTVWSNMPKLGLNRFIVFIATITGGSRSYYPYNYGDYYGSSSNENLKVHINPYLFEIKNGRRMGVLHGSFKYMKYNSPFRLNEAITNKVTIGAEVMNSVKDYEIQVETSQKRLREGNEIEAVKPKTKSKPKVNEEGMRQAEIQDTVHPPQKIHDYGKGEYSERTEDAEHDSNVSGQNEQNGQSKTQLGRVANDDAPHEERVVNLTTNEEESKETQPETAGTVNDKISTSEGDGIEQESLKGKTEKENVILTSDNLPDIHQPSTLQEDRSHINGQAEGKSVDPTLATHENEGAADEDMNMDTGASSTGNIPKENEQDRSSNNSNSEVSNTDEKDKGQLKEDVVTPADDDLQYDQGTQSSTQHDVPTENLQETSQTSEKHENNEDEVTFDTGDVIQEEKRTQTDCLDKEEQAENQNQKRQDIPSLFKCSICLKTSDDPRTLHCLHSFCKKCLENFVAGNREDKLRCPACRCQFTVNKEGATGMTKNHFICSMVEVLSIQHQHKCIPCSHCQQTSAGRCVTCELFMCEKCIQSHNGYLGFKDHVVLTVEELSKPENQSKIKKISKCQEHPEKKVEYYCEICDELLCSYCRHCVDDKQHKFSRLEEAAQNKRKDLKTNREILEKSVAVSEQETIILKENRKTIDYNFDEAQSVINERKEHLLSKLEEKLREKTNSMIDDARRVCERKTRNIDTSIEEREMFSSRMKSSTDMVRSLLENGNDEEIVRSCQFVQENVNGAKETRESLAEDCVVLSWSSDEIDTMLLAEIKDIIEDKDELEKRRKHHAGAGQSEALKAQVNDNNECQLISQGDNDDLIRSQREDPVTNGHRESVYKTTTGNNMTTYQSNPAAEGNERRCEEVNDKFNYALQERTTSLITRLERDDLKKKRGTEDSRMTKMDARTESLTTSQPSTKVTQAETNALGRRYPTYRLYTQQSNSSIFNPCSTDKERCESIDRIKTKSKKKSAKTEKRKTKKGKKSKEEY